MLRYCIINTKSLWREKIKKNNKDNDSNANIAGTFTTIKWIYGSVRKRLAKSQDTIRSVIALVSSNLVTAVLSAIGGLLVARFLGPEITGPFRGYTIPLTYLIFLHLGTWDALWRQIPYYVGKGKNDQVDEIASTAGNYNIFLSFFFSIVFLVLALYSLIQIDLMGFFGWLSQALATWSVFYGGYLASTYRTLHHFVALSRIRVAKSIAIFGMVFLLPFMKFYGLCARVALPSVFEVWLLHRYRPLQVSYHFNVKTFKNLIKIGLPFSIWGNLYTTFWFATESALILFLEGTTVLGLFSVAVVMRNAMNSLPISIWKVLTPRVVINYSKDGSVSKANHRIIWVTVGLVALMILMSYLGSVVLDSFVPYFIPKYIDGLVLMKVCLWFSVVEAAFLPLNILFATGKPWVFGRSVIPGILVFSLATYLLIPVMGGALAVVVGSMLGRYVRIAVAYIDIALLTKYEKNKEK